MVVESFIFSHLDLLDMCYTINVHHNKLNALAERKQTKTKYPLWQFKNHLTISLKHSSENNRYGKFRAECPSRTKTEKIQLNF